MISTHINDDGFRKVSRQLHSDSSSQHTRQNQPSGYSNNLTGLGITARTQVPQNTAAPTITEKVIDGLTHGRTPRMIANHLSLPLDLVDLIIERERAVGHLDIYDLRSCNSTTGEGCDPDPESLVCAGCPILPAAIRKRQSIFGRLKARLHK